MYTFENICLEDHTLKLREGCKTLFLSTQGKNPSEVPEKLVRFLHFVKADLRGKSVSVRRSVCGTPSEYDCPHEIQPGMGGTFYDIGRTDQR